MAERVPDPVAGDEPLDPAVERVRAKLMRFVVINLGILFLAVMAVVGALVYRAVSTDDPGNGPASTLPIPPAGSPITGEIALPSGATIVSQSLVNGQLTLLVDNSGRREIVVYDIGAARIVARFAIVSE